MIGIISDTHDNIPKIKKSVEEFKKRNCTIVVHCGDIVAPGTVAYFKGLNIKFVRGNCDGDIELIKKRVEEISGEHLGDKGEIIIEGKRIGIYHGHKPIILEEMIKKQSYDYILTGHTHNKRDELIGKTRVINPGCLYLGNVEHSIAILNETIGKVENITL